MINIWKKIKKIFNIISILWLERINFNYNICLYITKYNEIYAILFI